MSFCWLIPGTCTVECTGTRQYGGQIAVPNGPVGRWNVKQFVKSYPNAGFTVPPYCAGGSGGASGPVTGPGSEPDPEPEPDPCAPTVPVPTPVLPPPQDAPPGPITGEGAFGTGGPGADGGAVGLQHMIQPEIGRLVAVPVVAAMTDDMPMFTREAHIERNERGSMRVRHPGTGPGQLVLMSPELFAKNVYGDGGVSGDNDGARFTDNISRTGLLLFNAEGHGDDALAIVAFGKRVPGTDRPGSGLYMALDPSNRNLTFQHTSAAGADDDAAGWVSMNQLHLRPVDDDDIPTPSSGLVLFCDEADGLLKTRDSNGVVNTVEYVGA